MKRAFADMERRLGAGMGGAVVQQMAPPGVETIIGVTHDPSFGPLVLFGLGGVTGNCWSTAGRIVPITDEDAHELVRALRGSPLLFGYRGPPRSMWRRSRIFCCASASSWTRFPKSWRWTSIPWS